MITHDPLAAFLFELMEDHVEPETVERIIASDEENDPETEFDEWHFTDNDALAEKAVEFAKRLRRLK